MEGSIADDMFYSREENPSWSTQEVRGKMERVFLHIYPDFKFLYPDLKMEAISDNELADVLEGKTIQQVLGIPEFLNHYHLIRQLNPHLPESYPNVDLTKLSQSHLEKLARGEPIEKTLGILPRITENHYELIQKQTELAQQALDPKKTSRYNRGRTGNVREAESSRGKGNTTAIGNGNYRHGKSRGTI